MKIISNNKYFLYARKSTDVEDKQVQSLEDQINIMKERAKNTWIEIIEVFQESMSAKAPWRFRFNEMIQRIQRWEAKGIVAWKLDRLTRNPVDTGTIQFMLQNGQLDRIITHDKEYNPIDAWLLFSVETGMSNQFILDLKKSVKRWMDSKTDRWVFCWKAPEGYRNNKLEKTIEVDEKTFPLVKKMWDLMLTWNYSVSQVMNVVNEEWWYRNKKGYKLALPSLYKLFANPFFTGDFMWNWDIKKGTHKPMISYTEFQRVQDILWKKGLCMRWKTREFAYTGFIKCWECGGSITAEEKSKIIKSTWERKTYVYYHCTKRIKGKECLQKPINLTKLEAQIIKMVSSIEIFPDFKEWILDALKDDFKNDIDTQEIQLDSLYWTLRKEERKLNKLTDSLIAEIIGQDDYIIRKKHLKIDIENIKEQIGKINNKKNDSVEITEQVFDFAIQAVSKFNYWSLQEKKEILRSLGKNCILFNWKLELEAFPWFWPIKKLSPKMKENKSRLELIKNSTVKGITSAKNSQKCEWYSKGKWYSNLSRALG